MPNHSGHFYTGYDSSWDKGGWQLNTTIGPPKSNMRVGENVIIEGPFRITGNSRGRSAANFHGNFLDHEGFTYDLSMDGVGELWQLVQAGIFPIRADYIEGKWTIAKQGQSIFLKPYNNG